MILKRIPLLLLAGLLLAPPPAAAGALYNKPVYFPKNDTYYELVQIATAYPGKYKSRGSVAEWIEVMPLAARRAYKGRRGRLAMVGSKAVNDFLRDTFKPDQPTFIGLRYWCRKHASQWVTGKVLKPGQYRNWGRVWNTNNYIGTRVTTCTQGAKAFWPVHYWPVGHPYGFTWNAAGTTKWYSAFFVEYPPSKASHKKTGQKTNQKTEKKKGAKGKK